MANAESKPQPIQLSSPGGEIGKKELLAIKRRFQNLQKLRLQRIQEFLTPRQRAFLELLPLLFHRNHPALPGFISSDTPSGIPDYSPDKPAIRQAKKLSKSFVFKKRAKRIYPIQGLYLMGSGGTIAYSKKSDLDIWLCHSPKLSGKGFAELHDKTKAVEHWAESLGLEVHFFFIDTEGFREGKGTDISKESCGNSQHHLLLEEFYRTGLHIAGSFPVWWLVPPHQEHNYDSYVRHLLEKRFISKTEIIDFGGLTHVPAEEFLSASLWHLYKAIGSPYKSLLKLLLTEKYAHEYPKTEWISFKLKQEIYEGCLDINELDPYLLMYKKVEEYLLEQKKENRLELARQCFYYKTTENLNSQPKSSIFNWRSEILDALLKEWGWKKDKIQRLDVKRHWNIEHAIQERNLITKELNFSYRTLTQFARQQGHDSAEQSDELELLGRKLRAALEKKPGKIEVINSDLNANFEEEHLTLQQIPLADGQNGWALFKGQLQIKETSYHTALRKTQSLLELLAWGVVNRLFKKNSIFTLLTPSSEITATELHSILRSLNSLIRQRPAEGESLVTYNHSPQLISTALFINVGTNPVPDMEKGRHLMSNRSDSLSYGAMRTNMIHSVEQVIFTSWHEILIRRYEGLNGFMDCLRDTVNFAQPNHAYEKSLTFNFDCLSFNSPRARSIALRGKDVLQSLKETLETAPENSSPRYLLRGEDHFYLFQKSGSGLHYWKLDDNEQLYEELAKPQSHFSPVTFDSYADETTPLPMIYKHNRAGTIQFFYLIEDEEAELFLLDERGSLFHQRQQYKDQQSLLEPSTIFIDSILSRGALLQDQANGQPAYKKINYYKIHKESSQQYRVQQTLFFPSSNSAFLELRVVQDNKINQTKTTSIYCDGQEFSSLEYGDQLFQKVAEQIKEVRSGIEDYPIYITDIDIPPQSLGAELPSQLQTTHFLRQKQKIEDRLNCL
jgi:adenylate cyclase class 1